MKFRNTHAWIIKHKECNHMIRRGIYQTLIDAQEDFDTMPEFDNNGCGKKSDYEIKRIMISTK